MTSAPPGVDPAVWDDGLESLRVRVLELVKERGYRRFDEPVALASGELSHDFIDGKAACASGPALALVCRAMLEAAAESGAEFDAVGGLTLGADHFSHGIALLSGCDWFTVRKQPKGRGTNQRIEGTALGVGVGVLLVDDVVTTGGSIEQAYEAIQATGAEVRCATTLIDRGNRASRFFEDEGVAYLPILTYEDLGIKAVGDAGLAAATR